MAEDGQDAGRAKVQSPVSTSTTMFKVLERQRGDPGSRCCAARTGELFNSMPTPRFTLVTSKAMTPLRPDVTFSQLGGRQQILQVPIGDILLRQDKIATHPEASTGLNGFYPHFKGHITYCSYRHPCQNPSIHGGDSVCSVETFGGRRKCGPKEVLSLQRTMRANIVACPGEEVTMDVAATRRMLRTVTRAGEWLKEMLEKKAEDDTLKFDWHVLATIQGGNDIKLRQKSCQISTSMAGVSGFSLGGFGYGEGLRSRACVVQSVVEALPEGLPRFLPLHAGSPEEVLQAVALGIDVLEITYPFNVAQHGLALVFSCDMPADWAEDADADEQAFASMLPAAEPAAGEAPHPVLNAADLVKTVARQLQLGSPDLTEDFEPITEDSSVRQYSRAYIHHLLNVRELLATQLLQQHNLQVYENFFEAIRLHIKQGSFKRFLSWFLRTQIHEAPPQTDPGPSRKKRKL